MVAQREVLGEKVTEWLAAHPTFKVVDIATSQSSDSQFHCIGVTVFYREELPERPVAVRRLPIR